MDIFKNIFRRKLRTVITIFGIVIGIMSLVIMGAMAEKINILVNGANKYLEHRITIVPKGSEGATFGSTPLFSSDFVEDIEKIAGVLVVEQMVTLPFDEKMASFSPDMIQQISGIILKEREMAQKIDDEEIHLTMAQGSWWDQEDTGKAVIGVDMADKHKLEVGTQFENRGEIFEVVGILNRMMTVPDNVVYVPIEDARRIMTSTHPMLEEADSNFINNLYLLVDGTKLDETIAELRESYPDYAIYAPEEMMNKINSSTALLNLIILGSAMIALIIGALSIINTMIMAVTERTREIGIKKALGARNGDILKEYLSEATIIGFLGGTIGLGGAILFVTLVNSLTSSSGTVIFTITPRLAVGSIVFSALLGVLAGLYPAISAAKLDPINALKK